MSVDPYDEYADTFTTFERIPRKKQPYLAHNDLSDLFPNESRLLEALAVAELRIIEAFFYAKEERRGHMVATPGCIGNVGNTVTDLTQHVLDFCHMCHHNVVVMSDLPRGMSRRHLMQALADAEHDLVQTKAAQLSRQCNIWYNEHATGVWEIQQSLMDKFRLDRDAAHQLHWTDQTQRRENKHGGSQLMKLHGNRQLTVVH